MASKKEEKELVSVRVRKQDASLFKSWCGKKKEFPDQSECLSFLIHLKDTYGNKIDAIEKGLPDVPGVVKRYYFTNVNYPGLLCSLCGEDTYGKYIIGQKHEDESKSYLCPDCQVSSHTDEKLFRLEKRKLKLDMILKRLNKEIKDKMVELEDSEGWLRTNKVTEQIRDALIEKAKKTTNQELKQLLHKYMRVFTDLLEIERDLADLQKGLIQKKSVEESGFSRKAKSVQTRRRRGWMWKISDEEWKREEEENKKRLEEMMRRKKARTLQSSPMAQMRVEEEERKKREEEAKSSDKDQ